MSKRSDSQRIGSEGHRLVQYLIESAGGWIARSQDEDFGVDLEAERDEPEVQGQLLKVQVKSSRTATISDQGVLTELALSLLKYADQCRVPVIQVQVDLDRKEAWYVWVQQWLLQRRRTATGLSDLPQSSSVYVPIDQTLVAGLQGELQDVARWSTETQLVLTLNDAVRTAASLYQHEVLNELLSLLGRLDGVSEDFPVELIIDQAVTLGQRLWGTMDGNTAANALYAVCRKFGHRFTAAQVVRMVTREDSYSRTGINALGFLYDEHPEHIANLGLVAALESNSDPRAAYYCALRERHRGRKVLSMLKDPAMFSVGRYALDPEASDRLFDKWANRGDSAILDFLVETTEDDARAGEPTT